METFLIPTLPPPKHMVIAQLRSPPQLCQPDIYAQSFMPIAMLVDSTVRRPLLFIQVGTKPTEGTLLTSQNPSEEV